jgi:predicted metal-dependent enzyme (double-stranded beta helix superfamily)
VNKALYKPLSWVVGALGGILAGQVFKQVWSRVAGEDDAPDATDRDYTWRQVVIAAAVQGAIFGAVKAATERAGAVGYRKATGDWPGDD